MDTLNSSEFYEEMRKNGWLFHLDGKILLWEKSKGFGRERMSVSVEMLEDGHYSLRYSTYNNGNLVNNYSWSSRNLNPEDKRRFTRRIDREFFRSVVPKIKEFK